MNNSKTILGVNLSHDTAVAAVREGEVLVAIAEERLNRVKHCTGVTQFGKVIPYRSIRYCCEHLGISPNEVDLFVTNSCRSNALEQLRMQLIGIPEDRVRDVPHPGHHAAHAYSTLYCSPFDEAAVLILDTNGSFIERPGSIEAHSRLEKKEHYTCFHGDGSGMTVALSDFVFPGEVSLGELYCIYSAALQLSPRQGPYGFDDPLSAGGKLMGLAAHGKRPTIDRLWSYAESHMSISLDALVDRLGDLGFVEQADRSTFDRAFGFNFATMVELKRRQDSLREQRYLDLAAEAQSLLETATIEIARRLHAVTKSKNLCVAGGNMLNVTACTRILEETPFERIFVQPAANDAGVAIGAALYGYREVLGGRARPYLEREYSTCLGHTYSNAEVRQAIDGPRGSAFLRRHVPSIDDKVRALMPLLASDQIVAVFDGGSEFGPRALGHRSLLASPKNPGMKDKMNELKRREWYRPVAPVVLESAFPELFTAPFSSAPYMTLAARCRPIVKELAPAIEHVDQTSRPQTVTLERNPLLHALLVAAREAIGVPMLINTSFNIDGEPIVETPLDAVATLDRAPLLDALLIGDWLLEKPKA
ncbi:MAG: hypothetical protein HY791_16155 [Deltaproteobacteria bacterium]|nr:hypothetical protein [Deltaproteobacteria bacterium]